MKQDESPKSDTYFFLLGPKPELTKGKDQRLEVRMPKKYIVLESGKENLNRIELGQFTFAVRFPTGSPVARDELALPNVVITSAIWEPSGSVARRVDGTWQNHFSRYLSTNKERYDLAISRAPEINNESLLFISDDKKTIIECQKMAGHKPTSCNMLHNAGENNLTMEMVFSPDLLSNWRDILSMSKRLISDIRPHTGE